VVLGLGRAGLRRRSDVQVPGIDQVVEQIVAMPGARRGSGASEEEVAVVERWLGASLPPGFRTFLLRVGWLVLPDLEVLGAGADVLPEVDLVGATNDARAGGLPANAFVVGRDPSTPAFCLDAAHVGPYESPVYRWQVGGQLEYVAHDFASWLWMRLAAADPGGV
jgi:hypothetical protein